MTPNYQSFLTVLTNAYVDLYANDPEYAYAKAHKSPAELATVMTEALARGTGNKDGKGIRSTCKRLAIKYTYAAIREFLKS
jgi:hypothetical protein